MTHRFSTIFAHLYDIGSWLVIFVSGATRRTELLLFNVNVGGSTHSNKILYDREPTTKELTVAKVV